MHFLLMLHIYVHNLYTMVEMHTKAAFQNVSIQSLYAVPLLCINYASTINPMPDCFLTALKIHIDDVF